MLRKNFLLGLVVLTTVFGFSQNRKIDSLRVLLVKYEKQHEGKKRSIQDSVEVNLYNKMSAAHDYERPQDGVRYAERALNLALKIGYEKGQADAYFQMARIGGRAGSLEKSIGDIQKAIKIYIRLGNELKIADCYNNIAVFYAQKGDFPEATHHFLQALKIYEKLGDKAILSGAYGNMGTLYKMQGDLDKAMKYYLKALKLREGANQNSIEFAGIYLNLGSIHYKQEKIEKAIEMYQKAYRIAVLRKNAYMEGEVLSNWADCYQFQGKYDRAMELYTKARDIFLEIPNNEGVATCNNGIGYCYFRKGNTQQALSHIKLALKLAKKDNYFLMQKRAYNYLSEIYWAEKNYEQAYKNEVAYKEISDTIFNKEKERKIVQMQLQYDFDKIQDEARQLQSENELKLREESNKQRMIKRIIEIALLFVSVLTFGIFYNLKENKKQKEIISEQKDLVDQQNEVIRKSLEEKETLLREIHHRVKNNLQIVSSLLNIQSQHIADEGVLDSIREGQGRVQAMSLIHQNLYQSSHLNNVDIQNYLEELVAYIREIFNNRNKNIQILIEANNIQFDIDTAIPLGLIVNELVSNAYKYAFGERESGTIRIQVKALDGIEYELLVSDDGVGLPPAFQPRQSRTLGFKLVNILSRQLRGTMKADTGVGTSIIIRFKDIKAYHASIS